MAQARLAQSAVSLCKELVEQPGEATKLSAAAERLLQTGDVSKAFQTAAEALAKALHTGAEELILLGASFSKQQSAQVEMTAKGILNEYREAKDAKGEALALGTVADMYLCCRETSKALKTAQAAVSAFRKIEDKKGEASVLRTLINVHLAKAAAGVNPQLEIAWDSEKKLEAMKQQKEGEMDLAIETAKEAVALFRAIGDRRGEAEFMNKIAEVHLFKDEADQAMAVSREVRAIYTELNDPHGEAQALHTTINANMTNQEDTDDALTAAKDVVKLFQGRDRKTDQEDKRAIANALHTVAQVHLARFETQEALENAQSALSYFLEADEKKYGTALVLNTISQIHQVDGKEADALKAARQSMEAYQDIDYRPGEANAMHNLAYMELDGIFSEVSEKPDTFTKEQSEKLEQAWKDAIKALEIFKELKMADGEDMVTDTINTYIEKARKIHVQQCQPTKSIFLNDPKTRTNVRVNIYDTTMPEALADDEEEDEEEDEG